MLPLRGFQLVSDLLNYNGGLTAEVFFNTKTQAFSRAAIIGIEYQTGADPFAGLATSLDRFDVAGRPYKQGDAFPLGLIAPGAFPIVGAPAAPVPFRRYFPGSKIPLSGGGYCSGMMVNGREDIRATLTKLVPTAGDLQTITLHCLEFPVKAYPRAVQDRIDFLWDKFRSGIGQFHIVSNRYDVAAGASLQTVLEALVNPPHTQNARRMEAVGLQLADDGVALALDEAGFIQNSAQFFGTTNAAHSNAGVPARNIIGHSAFFVPDQIAADFERDTRSLNRWTVPVAASTIAGFIGTCFEGTDAEGVKLCGPSVF